MAYSTNKELLRDISEETLVQLTDDNNVGVVNWEIVEEKRTDVDALIDVYCANRYPVPFDPTPRVINRLARQMLVFELYNRKLGAPDHLKEQHAANMQLLEHISDGTVTIADSAGIEAPAVTADPGIIVAAPKPRFPHRRWDKF